MEMKQTVCTIFGALGGALAGAFGGWDGTLMTLVILMAADYVTGVLVAGVFHKSDKTGTGTLRSRADVALAEQEGALPIFEEPDRPKEVTH